MASYSNWNDALAEYFTEGLSSGDALYLSVDEDALMQIWVDKLAGTDPLEAVRDFEWAVRSRCVVSSPHQRVVLPPSTPERAGSAPQCIGFLGAMVLAAHRMRPEEDIADINYFTRLREVLDMLGDNGRPAGLAPPAPEERLWAALNDWILSNGWQPTANRGPDGPTKYTSYPLSQSLLRQGDKEKLEGDFKNAEGELGRDSDREKVGAWFVNRASGFATAHIRQLALEATMDRYDAIIDAVYTVYAAVDWDGQGFKEIPCGQPRKPKQLMAGLYRNANPILGTIDYLLFPRRQTLLALEGLSVMRDEVLVPLHRERDGQFRPLWAVGLSGGQNYPLAGNHLLTSLSLPARDFWVLTRDRFDEALGAFASRGNPRIGEMFVLLCRKKYSDQLEILREEALMNWAGEPVDVIGHDGWVEYRECMVVSANWEGIIPVMRDLFDELRPRSRASISLQGGLKTGMRDVWVEGYLPELAIISFDSVCRVRLIRASASEGDPILEDTVQTNTPVDLPQLTPGDYWLEALGNNRLMDSRYMRVRSWGSLEPSKPREPHGIRVGGHILRGGTVVKDDGNEDEE